jgi:hypothetical protein
MADLAEDGFTAVGGWGLALDWYGGTRSSGHAARGNPEKNEKKLQKATADLFKRFPPKSKG